VCERRSPLRVCFVLTGLGDCNLLASLLEGNCNGLYSPVNTVLSCPTVASEPCC